MDLKQILLAAIVLLCHQVSSYVDDFEEFEEDRENLLQDSLQSAILRGSDIGDRKFYVRVEYKGSNEFCGGVFIHHLWILTAASCLQGENPALLRVETADFPNRFRSGLFLRPRRWIIMGSFQAGNGLVAPQDDLALIQLIFGVFNPDDQQYFLPLCSHRVPQDTDVGVCGMGQVNEEGIRTNADSLKEAHLKVDYFREPFIPIVNEPTYCDGELICTSVDETDAKISYGDLGSPLYQFDPVSQQPSCLYGVASFFRYTQRRTDQLGHPESFFTNVTHFAPWIMATMEKWEGQ
ncbi:azurocidin-like [Symsagittifera roscoffensis]|uniref:azurocidin-like n=1 Tax=Symsagittifera roscoffensis TaxID=84072 RepID=UPI00307CBFA1